MALKADVRFKNKLYDSLSTIAGNPDFEYVFVRAYFGGIIKPKYFWVQEITALDWEKKMLYVQVADR